MAYNYRASKELDKKCFELGIDPVFASGEIGKVGGSRHVYTNSEGIEMEVPGEYRVVIPFYVKKSHAQRLLNGTIDEIPVAFRVRRTRAGESKIRKITDPVVLRQLGKESRKVLISQEGGVVTYKNERPVPDNIKSPA